MRYTWIGLAVLLLFSTGCEAQVATPTPEEGAIALYYTVSTSTTQNQAQTQPNHSSIDMEYCLIEGTITIDAMFQALMDGPTTEGLTSPFPSNLYLRSWRWEEGALKLDLSEHYGGLSGVALTLADYCLVLTFCQMSNVDTVELSVNGAPLPYHNRQVMSPDDILVF